MILINDFRFIIIYRYYWLLFLLVTPNIKGDYRNYTNYSNYVNDRICSESRWNGHFFNGQKQKIKKTPLNFSKAIGSKDFGLCLRSLGAQVLTIFDQKGWPKRCTTSGRLPLHIAWIRRGLGELGHYRRTNVWWCRWCKCNSDNHHSVNHLHLFNFNDLKHHWSQFNHRRCLSWHSSVCRGLLSYEGQTWGWVVSTFFTLWHLPRKSRPVWDRVSNLQMFASQTVQDADISWPHC